MATTDKKGGTPAKGAPKQSGGGKPSGKSGKEKRGGEARARGPHAGAHIPAPPPRLRAMYQAEIRPKLMQQFGLTNPHQVPTLEKIVLNVGVGEAIKQPKMLDKVVEELATITGQQPVRKKAKKSIANFGLRQGQEIGAAVTLRGARMWEFLDRFISVAVPRIRDFRGLGTRSFDGRGNYSLGVKEQMIFPEINYDDIEQIHGMDITFVTSAERDDLALALLKELGMPFRGDDKKGSRLA
jgi:large subunit ribosomal protein L5